MNYLAEYFFTIFVYQKVNVLRVHITGLNPPYSISDM